MHCLKPWGYVDMLKVGDKAPNFELKDQKGKNHKLSDYTGKRVVLYFYPKDDTPGCTKEACSLRDGLPHLSKSNFVVLGISADTVASHADFSKKFKLNFPILADPEMNVIKAYDAYGKKNLYGKIYEGILRYTYLIDEKGVITKIFKKVDTENHASQVLKA